MLNRIRRMSVLAVAIVSVAISTVGDTITLQDGSIMKGKIASMDGASYLLDTEFAGQVKIKATKITSVSTDGMVNVAFKSGNTVIGKLEIRDGATAVQRDNGRVDMTGDSITAIWLEGQPNPLIILPEARKWQYELSLDMNGKTGNTEKLRTGGNWRATLSSSTDKFLVYVRGDHAKENGQKTAEELIGGIDYEANVTPKNSWYLRTELENDKIEGVELRTTAAAGYGYFVRNLPAHVFRTRLGLQYRHESFYTAASKSSPGFDIGLHHMLDSKKAGKFTTDITYTPSFENISDYRAYHESAWEVPLGRLEFLTMKLGVSNEYNSSTPRSPNDMLDTTYFTRLVMSWK